MNTTVDCYVDPACPFAWATSRWLTDVTEQRDDVTLTLRQMSLATLNAEAIAGGEMDPSMAHHMDTSRTGGRLLASVDPSHFAEMYAALGRRVHLEHLDITADAARDALTECGLDPGQAAATDDPTLDERVEAAHAHAVRIYGESSGTPIVAIDGRAFFGPVITEIPTDSAAADLFDAVVVLAHSSSFAQMQRPRSGPPTLTKG
ncbi:mycothiol-dependent nitroreductase Rv2466c family protein [Williamsia phyllosphaerae]|uniref:DSBA oxidoreductase n=1 Tax=Williamsia phyllosphaerae TaxID=885042 RepID=A0ABQ1V448_9NOCA|nr:DsbA family protein [Williamsia phyllosphaerae]GGF37346.1 DSBA oxidoreductase [Williamsia phyllosphaerae]